MCKRRRKNVVTLILAIGLVLALIAWGTVTIPLAEVPRNERIGSLTLDEAGSTFRVRFTTPPGMVGDLVLVLPDGAEDADVDAAGTASSLNPAFVIRLRNGDVDAVIEQEMGWIVTNWHHPHPSVLLPLPRGAVDRIAPGVPCDLEVTVLRPVEGIGSVPVHLHWQEPAYLWGCASRSLDCVPCDRSALP